MSDLSTAEFEARIALATTSYEASAKQLGLAELRQSVREAQLLGASNDCAVTAFCLTYLGRRTEARHAFRKSADLASQLIRLSSRPNPQILLAAVELALVGGDANTENYLTRTGLPIEHEDFSPLATSYLRALLALRKGDSTEAEAASREALALDSTAAKWKFWSGLGTVCLGILQADTGAMNRGLDSVLSDHIKLGTRGYLSGAPAALLCIPAVALGVLARRRGLIPSVDASFHSVKLPFTTTHLETWDGKRAGRQKFTVSADLFPDELIVAQ